MPDSASFHSSKNSSQLGYMVVTTSGHGQDIGVVLFQSPWPFPHTAETSHGYNPGAAAISDPFQDQHGALEGRADFPSAKDSHPTPGVTQKQAGAAFPLPASPLPSCLPPLPTTLAHAPGAFCQEIVLMFGFLFAKL